VCVCVVMVVIVVIVVVVVCASVDPDHIRLSSQTVRYRDCMYPTVNSSGNLTERLNTAQSASVGSNPIL